MAVFRVEKVRDYTVVSNAVFKDRTLSAKAKGILVEMLSLPEDWDYTMEGLATLFADGLDSIRQGIRELEKHGYIVRKRVRNDKGQLKENEYTIYETPQVVENSVGNKSKTCRKAVEKPFETTETDDFSTPFSAFPAEDSPALENPIQASPVLENPTTNKILTQSNTNVSNTYPSNPNQEAAPERARTDRMGYEEAKEIIQENVDYEILCDIHSPERVDEIVGLAVETLCSGMNAFEFTTGIYPYKLARDRILCLRAEHIAHIIRKIDSNTTKIHNIKKYLLKTILDAPVTYESELQTTVNHDMYGEHD